MPVLFGQVKHANCPGVEMYVFNEHKVHFDAPDAAANWPVAQPVHAADDRASLLYVPASHAVTDDPLPVKPASARQSDRLDEPAALLLLDGQASQLSYVCAVSVLKVPGLHIPEHSDAPVPVSNFPAAQSSHEADPLRGWFVPEGQLWQPLEPMKLVNVPAGHASQVSEA